ncbi:hypothetical protein TGARI_201660 [Toxoplasma gondii ARI]|uniref:Uncharacterized protein n=1 Tax=Toxoplasma gondii ARI TaxID=1074872 RepID=A0A139XZ33_TOXGO|nr:hypothetical protein TGARI_201660 [Toxoplasma gondii ARI]
MRVTLTRSSLTCILVVFHGDFFSLVPLPTPAWSVDTEVMNVISLPSVPSPTAVGLPEVEYPDEGSFLSSTASVEIQQRHDPETLERRNDMRGCIGGTILDPISSSAEWRTEGIVTSNRLHDLLNICQDDRCSYTKDYVNGDFVSSNKEENAYRWWTGFEQYMPSRGNSLSRLSSGWAEQPLIVSQDTPEVLRQVDQQKKPLFTDRSVASVFFPFTSDSRPVVLPGETSSVLSEKRRLQPSSTVDSAMTLREGGSEPSANTASSEGLSSSREEEEPGDQKEVMGLGDMIAAGRQRRQAVEALSMMGFQMPPGGIASMSPQQQQMMATFLTQQQIQSQRQGFAGQSAPMGSEQQLMQQFLTGQQQSQMMQEMMRGNQSGGRGVGRANRNHQGNSHSSGAGQRGGRQQQRQNSPSVGVSLGQMTMAPSVGFPQAPHPGNAIYSPQPAYSSQIPYTYNPFSPGGMTISAPSVPVARGATPVGSVPGVSQHYPSAPGVNPATPTGGYGYGGGVNTGAYASALLPGGGSTLGGFANQGNAGLRFTGFTGGNAASTPSPYDPNLQQRQSAESVDQAARWAEQLRRQQEGWARQNP